MAKQQQPLSEGFQGTKKGFSLRYNKRIIKSTKGEKDF